MGVAYDNIRKKSYSFHRKNKDEYQINKNAIKRRVTAKNSSKLINNFTEDNTTTDNTVQSKTDKAIENKKNNEEIINKKTNLTLKNIRSLSAENLVKLEGGKNFIDNNIQEEILPNSLDTNFSSNKSNGDITKKLLSEEIYNEIEENNSIDDEDNESQEEYENEEIEENDDKNNDLNKINQLMITKNIKEVFIISKQGKDPKEQNEQNDDSTTSNDLSRNLGSRNPSATFDYELNFYKTGSEIRESYISKLIAMKVWNPSMKPKQHNSMIIFDWDDTLLPTSFLTPGGTFNENIKLSETDKEKFLKLENLVYILLNEAIEKGNVYIITNAGKGWVEYSSNRFYPSIMGFLSKIEIISARGEYEKLFPGNSRQWKIQAFLNLAKFVNVALVTNIICLGDSLFEMEAGRILASKFKEAFIKTIKFKEAPILDELIKQLKLVCHQFGSIYSSIKNLTIRVEKKKKK
jgi:hypothetical protein